MAAHIDTCLGCMACMSVCPEDVAYGDLLATARVRDRARPCRAPGRAHANVDAALAALPRAGRVTRLDQRASMPHYTPAQGEVRGRVGLLLGCTQRLPTRELHAATMSVLSAEGYEVIAPRLPDCCGALELHSGERTHGLRRAEATIRAFAGVGGVDHVLTSAGSCGAAMKDYGRLLGTPEARAFSALVMDVHELLTPRPSRARFGPLSVRIAYHDVLPAAPRAGGRGRTPREFCDGFPASSSSSFRLTRARAAEHLGIYRVTQPEAAARAREPPGAGG